jgi:hypothetical protein
MKENNTDLLTKFKFSHPQPLAPSREGRGEVGKVARKRPRRLPLPMDPIGVRQQQRQYLYAKMAEGQTMMAEEKEGEEAE